MISVQRPVAAGMTAYIGLRFRPRVFGLEQLQLEPGTIMAPNHRSDNDVPLLVATLYPHWARSARLGGPWPTFAADDHTFLPGFLGGYPGSLPLWLRQLLWPIRVGGVLERHLRCIPVREPHRMLLVELLRAEPQRELDGQLPPELRAALVARAEERRRPAPRRGDDVLSGIYADLLWTPVDRDEVERHGDVWREHLRAAVGDFKRLTQTLEAGGLVVIYPEGELSVDGRIAPLKQGLASLARRGRARWVQPVAITYDPLAGPRPLAYVSVSAALVPAHGHVTAQVHDALRRAMPLTAGQLVAWRLTQGVDSLGKLEAAAREWIERARADRRPVEPALLGPGRRALLREAQRRAARRGRADPLLERLAAEFHDAHAR